MFLQTDKTDLNQIFVILYIISVLFCVRDVNWEAVLLDHVLQLLSIVHRGEIMQHTEYTCHMHSYNYHM